MNFKAPDMIEIKLIIDDQIIEHGDIYKIIDPLLYTVEIHETKEVYESTINSFTDKQKYVFAILWYKYEVDNGGHEQFFFNSTGIVWEDALNGFDKLGLKDNFDILKAAINIVGGSPSFDRAIRKQQLNCVIQDFEDLDDRFYMINDEIDIEQVLLKFIKENRVDFYFEGLVKVPKDD
jgi:hypothetical protein